MRGYDAWLTTNRSQEMAEQEQEAFEKAAVEKGIDLDDPASHAAFFEEWMAMIEDRDEEAQVAQAEWHAELKRNGDW